MKTVLLVFAVLLAVSVGALAWWLQEPNRFKPAIEDLITRETGRPVTIGGNLAWQLWPPLSITVERVATTPDDRWPGEAISTEHLLLTFDVLSLFEDASRWRVDSLALTDARYITSALSVRAPTFMLTDFTPDSPAPLSVDAIVTGTDGVEIPVSANGFVTYTPASDTWRLNARELAIAGQKGSCDITASQLDTPPERRDAPADITDSERLIPVDALLDWSINGECQAPQLTLADATFDNVRVDLDANDGHLVTTVNVLDFFDGGATLTADLTLTDAPLTWRVEPDLNNVATAPLLNWLQQDLRLEAPLTLSGSLTMTGNTVDALKRSVAGELFFDGAQGTLDITELKRPIEVVSATVGNADSVSRWPDRWQYQRFTGTWIIDGLNHRIGFVIDNLSVQGSGIHDWMQDDLDMNLTLTVSDDPAFSSFDINPLLVDLAIPVRCQGPLTGVRCKLDEAGARDLLGRALRGDANEPLKEKLEQTIEENVPEEFQDAARALLDLIGGALDDD